MSRRTAAPRAPRSASVSAGICWATSVARNSRRPTWSRVSSARAAASNSAQIESRSRCARRAVPPPSSTERRSRRGHEVPDHSVQSSSSAVAPAVELGARRRDEVGRPRGPGRPRDPSSPSSVAASRTAGGPARASGVGSRSSASAASFSRWRSCAGQAAYVARVEPAERAGQQRLRPGGVDVVDVVGVVVVEVEHHAQRVDQRQRGRVADQRHLVAGDLDRDPGGAERAAQRRDRLPARPHQHRHLVPGDAVLEVGPAQQVGEVLGLAAVAVEGAHRRPGPRRGRRRRPCGARNASRAASGMRAGQPDPPGDPLGGGQDPRPEAAGRAERDHLGRACRPRRGNSLGKSRMPRTSAPRNA